MLHIVLFRPEIPQNTGNIGRMCAFSGLRLHLIKPLGFELSDRYLKRSGMDYWQELDVCVHDDWQAFETSGLGPDRLFLFTTKGDKPYWDISFQEADGLLFGCEGSGAPEWLHEKVGPSGRVTIPRYGDSNLRSLNLATSAGIAAYEALRQLH